VHPERAESPATWTLTAKALSISLLLFAVLVSILGIERPLFVDEANSILIASDNLRGVISHLRTDDNLPLYYLLLHVWIHLFGLSEVATRLLSVFFYLTGIFATYLLGEQLSEDSWVGLYGAFLFAVSLQAIRLAQHVRMYSLLGLVATFSTLLFFRSFANDRRGSRRDLIFYILVNVAGSFIHVWFAFVLIAQLLCYFALFPRATVRRLLGSLTLSALPFLLLWGRFFLEQMANGSSSWMPKIGLWSAPGAVLEFYGGKYIGSVILGACGLLLLLRWRGPAQLGPEEIRPEQKRAQRALLLIFSTSVAVPLLVSLFRHIYFPGRYTIIALPSLAVLLAWRLAAKIPRPLLAGFASAVMVLVLSVHVATREDVIENSETKWTYANTDKHAAVEIAKGGIRPGDIVVFTGVTRAAVVYYLRRFHCDRGLTLISFPHENADHLGWDENRLDQAVLEQEAEEVAERLAKSERNGSLVFMVGSDRRTTAILAQAMNRQLSASASP